MRIFLLAIFFSSAHFLSAQLAVTSPANTNQATKNAIANYLLGDGVTLVGNATITGYESGSYGYGYFDGTSSNIGLDSGIVLTTGTITGAVGPNNTTGSSGCGLDVFTSGDADIDTEFGLPGWPGAESYDACLIEFDFTPNVDTVFFQYVFASEEYNEFVCSSFNDAFALFIEGVSGPAAAQIPTKENIALIPGTSTNVSINSVNNGSVGSAGSAGNCISLLNSAYFVDNTGGATVQYDGFTVPLTASRSLIAGETYHLKLVVADVNDHCKNSAIFIGAGSIKSTNTSCALDVNLAVTQTTCNQDNGAITATPVGGTGPYTYTWDNGGSTATISGLAPNNYTLNLGDNEGCTLDTIVTINPSIDLSLAISSQTNVNCFGDATGALTVNPTGNGGYLYTWDDPSTQTTATASGLVAGAYTVNVSDADGCTASIGATITEPAVGLSVSLTLNDPTCAGNDGDITAAGAGGTGTLVYNWNGAGPDGTTLSGLGAGSYDLTITDDNSCTLDSTITLSNPSNPTLSLVSQNNATCDGANDGDATVTVAGGTGPFNYSWDDPGAQTGTSASGLVAGTYTVTVSDANTCTDNLVVVITDPDPMIFTAVIGNASCGVSDGTASLSALGGSTPYDFFWNDLGYSSTSESGLAAGAYSISLTDNGTCSIDTTIIISNPTGPTLVLDSVSHVTCNGLTDGAAFTTVSGGGGSNVFLWNDPSAQSTEDASNLASGNYSLTVTDVNNCSASVAVTINEPNALSFSAILTEASCTFADGTAALSAAGGTTPYDFYWNELGYSSANEFTLAAGIYNIQLTDSNNCQLDTSITIVNANSPIITLDSLSNVSCAGGSDAYVAITASSGDGSYTYSWNDPASQVTDDATGLAAGNYNLVVTDGNFCTATASYTISEPDALSFTATTTNSSCGGTDGTAALSAAGGTSPYDFFWNDLGYSSNNELTLAAGLYSVSMTDANACTLDTTVLIEDATAPNLDLISSTDVSCWGGSDAEATVEASNGASPYTYFWNDPAGQIGATATGLGAYTYTVVVVDANNCLAGLNVTFSQPSSPIWVTINSQNPSCLNNDGLVDVGVSGGTTPYTFSWDNGLTTEDVTSAAEGSYNLIITDDNGCTETASATLTMPSSPVIDSISVVNATCYGDENGEILVYASGGNGDYVYSLNGDLASDSNVGLAAGDYNVVVEDESFCQDSETASISQPNQVVAGIDLTILESVVPTTVTFGNASENETNIEWFVDGVSIGSAESFNQDYTASGNYEMILWANNGGCMDSTSVSFELFDPVIKEIPNIFTPNNDGINDGFDIHISEASDVSIEIFNRWGTLVYEFQGQQKIFWDGKLASGSPASDGTYYFVLKYHIGDELFVVRDFVDIIQ